MPRPHALLSGGATVALLAVALAACTLVGRVDFVDHTGLGFQVSFGGGTLEIPRSGTAPRGVNYAGGESIIVIRQGLCTHVYDVPPTREFIPPPGPRGGMIVLQLEPDMRLHLMPNDSDKPVDPATLASLQRGGFPLVPVYSRCHPPAAG